MVLKTTTDTYSIDLAKQEVETHLEKKKKEVMKLGEKDCTFFEALCFCGGVFFKSVRRNPSITDLFLLSICS